MERVFVGIDPSINSTGICTLCYEDDVRIKENFFIVKPNKSKLTRKEQKAQDELLNFDYVQYNATDLKEYTEDNHIHELYKTKNMIEAVNSIRDILFDTKYKAWSDNAEIYIVIEGISYGSTLRTKSVFDLAGLNYMIRQILLKDNEISLTIATPLEIKKYATGNGNCNKDAIIALFKASHPDMNLPKVDDVADAYYMAKYARKIYKNENEN